MEHTRPKTGLESYLEQVAEHTKPDDYAHRWRKYAYEAELASAQAAKTSRHDGERFVIRAGADPSVHVGNRAEIRAVLKYAEGRRWIPTVTVIYPDGRKESMLVRDIPKEWLGG